jgi:hypothetical protein
MFYVYKVTDIYTNEYYIGSRKFDGNIFEDKYLGSPYTWKPNIKNLKKEIIRSDFQSMEEAILYERYIIVNSIDDSLNRNYSIPNGRFHRVNLITAISKSGKIVSIHKEDPLFGVEYFGITKGLTLVRNKEGNIFLVSKNDDRYLNGELVHNNFFTSNKGKSHRNWNKKQINNGISQKLVNIDEVKLYLDNGWILGTLQKNKRTISSHFDTIWVNKNSLNKRIKNNEIDNYISLGWKKGRVGLKKYKMKNENEK